MWFVVKELASTLTERKLRHISGIHELYIVGYRCKWMYENQTDTRRF